MSADKSKPTAGKWKVVQCKHWGLGVEAPAGDGTVYRIAGDIGGQTRKDESGNWSDHSEAETNASLIAEAGNVYHETGLTPRQLAEQRGKLLSQLRIMCGKFEGCMGDWENPEFHDEYNAALAIIAKCEATKPDEERTK